MHFELEKLITDRLKTITELKDVITWSAFGTIDKNPPQVTPVACVLYHRETVEQTGARGTHRVEQSWDVLLIIRNSTNAAHDKTRDEAGVVLQGMIKSLSGYTPESETGTAYSRLVRATARDAEYYGNIAIFPLRFLCSFVISAIN
jgi:hypothetical protein